MFCCDPGLVDTKMQKEIRNSTEKEFPEVKRFKGFKDDGHLVSPNIVANRILKEAKLL